MSRNRGAGYLCEVSRLEVKSLGLGLVIHYTVGQVRRLNTGVDKEKP
jgi:hypothetical protein